MTTARSRLGLARRLYLAAPAWSAAVGVLVVLVTALLVAVPRVVVAAADDELRSTLGDVRGTEGDFAAQVPGAITPGPGDAPSLDPDAAAVYGALDEQLASLVDSAAPAVRARLGLVDYVGRTGALTAPLREVRDDVPLGHVRFAFDPRILDRVEIVRGTPPAPASGDFSVDPVTGEATAPFDVIMSAASAEALGWEVGASRIVREVNSEVRLAGVFEANDVDDAVWTHVPSVLAPEVFDDGNRAPRAIATVYPAPGTVAAFPGMSSASRLTVWIPFDASSITLAEARSTLGELRRFTTQKGEVPALGAASLRFSSGNVAAIERVLARSDSTTALLVLVGAGPLGVAGAVLGLAAHGVVVARRPALELAAARGASPARLRLALAAEGALVAIPAAALGWVIAVLLTPGVADPASVLAALAVAMVPPAVFAARASFPLGRSARRDLGAGSRGRLRIAIDIVVCGVAAAATASLLAGGGLRDGRIDWLAVAAPLLIAVAGALIAERLLPAPTALALRRASRRRGLASFLGLARAVRDPSGSVASLALVVSVAIGLTSIVLLATVERGTVEASQGALGGDLRIESGVMSDEVIAELADVSGVASVAGIEAIGSVDLGQGRQRISVPAYVVDGAGLARIQSTLPAGLGDVDGVVPFIASPSLGAELATDELTIEAVDARLLGVADGAAGIGGGSWILVDREASELIGAGAFTPRVVVAALQPGADVDAVAAAVDAVVPGSRVASLDARIAEQRAMPTPALLRSGLLIAVVAVVLLAVVAIFMSGRVSAPRRNEFARSLHRMGTARRVTAATLVGEALPATLAALIVGVLLGLVIPFVVTTAVDLGPVVNGITAPRLVVDPFATAGIVVGSIVVAAVSILPALSSSRKESA